MRLMGNRLLVKPKEAEGKIGKFYIPESSREKSNIGVIVQIGNTVKEGEYKEGDEILYPKNEGVDINLEGKDLLIIHEPKVFMVL